MPQVSERSDKDFKNYKDASMSTYEYSWNKQKLEISADM